jgi:hypothetical protein
VWSDAVSEHLFTAYGDLTLVCQEGGYADDAFELSDPRDVNGEPFPKVEQRDVWYSDSGQTIRTYYTEPRLADLITQHFGAQRDSIHNRPIGRVRITIERIDP